jgi:glutathione S-transferase
MLRETYPARYTDDPAGAEAVRRSATAYVRRHFQLLDGQAGPGPFLLGEGLRMVDIYLWMLCWWIDLEWLAATCPALDRLLRAASVRPPLERAAVRHFGRGRP